MCPPSSHDFIAALAAGDVYLDSYPFGGCSSIIDALIVNQPVVSLSGTKYSNRCGPHLLETAGLGDFAVHSERDYFRTAVRTIGDAAFRREQKDRMVRLDWGQLLFDRNGQRERDYVAAFRFLFAGHNALVAEGGHDPLRVPELCSQGSYAQVCAEK